jgi:CubicO group peptidase (beta-lactamase class C family)
MSSGLAFEERYGAGAEATEMLFRTADMAAFAAARPLAHAPGTVWSYSSGTTNILSGLVRRSFGGDDRAYLEFPRRALFEPLGMRSAVLETDASGTFVGSSFLYATARDWARFGLLYLHDGVVQPGSPPASPSGTRLLPEGWVDFARRPAPAAPKGQYGAQWWLNPGARPEDRVMPSLPPDLFYAQGFQEQSVVVVPSRGAVIVRLGLTNDESAWNLEAFVAEVLAALQD